MKTLTPPASAAWYFSFCLSRPQVNVVPDTTGFSRVVFQFLPKQAEQQRPTVIKVVIMRHGPSHFPPAAEGYPGATLTRGARWVQQFFGTGKSVAAPLAKQANQSTNLGYQTVLFSCIIGALFDSSVPIVQAVHFSHP